MSFPDDRDTARTLLGWGGKYGSDYFSDTNAHTAASVGAPSWNTLIAVGATVVAALTDTSSRTATASTHPTTLADGQTLRGTFTSVTLTSGAVSMRRDAPEDNG